MIISCKLQAQNTSADDPGSIAYYVQHSLRQKNDRDMLPISQQLRTVLTDRDVA